MRKKTLRTLGSLVEHGLVSHAESPLLAESIKSFSLAIPAQVQALIEQTGIAGPIAKQFVPSRQELIVSSLERADPIGDQAHVAVKGIVHRYPDRCLFMPVQVCAVYCRFCFRREKVGRVQAGNCLTPAEFTAAYAYIAAHKEIWEVILTGGDPLILKPKMLKSILAKLRAIDHVEVLRIHTRVPIVDSARINTALLAALQGSKPVYVALHANHPAEFTPEVSAACAALVDAGVPLLSQTTLLTGVNDDIDTLSTLMRCFIKNRIKPYYLHHTDLVKGTQHFRATIAHGQQLMRQLRGRFSGICQPMYVLDIPGGYGKVPIGPVYLNLQDSDDERSIYQVEDYLGEVHCYEEHNNRPLA